MALSFTKLVTVVLLLNLSPGAFSEVGRKLAVAGAHLPFATRRSPCVSRSPLSPWPLSCFRGHNGVIHVIDAVILPPDVDPSAL